jgi:uncharacterized damage-inducible protein DinB
MTPLLEQLTYDRWANLCMIDGAKELDSQAFKQQVTSSFPSVHQTLVHILWAEELWLERWQGRSFVQSLDPEEFPSLQIVRKRLEDIHARQMQFLKGLSPEAADPIVGYVNFQGQRWEYPLRQTVQHLTVHSAYHRGQLATLLRQLGVVPPSTDYLVFVDTRPVTRA